MQLTKAQEAILQSPLEGCAFLHGEAGTGKTTIGTRRLIRLLEETPNDQILVLTPQRSMGSAYQHALSSNTGLNLSKVSLSTMGSLVRRMVALFWPVISEGAGFHYPYRPPQFLTLETAQYYMGHIVEQLLDQGCFSSVSIKRHRLYSQLIDNLNKSAVVGFSHQEIGERLCSAWVGAPAQPNVYQDVQTSINLFRDFCLQNNLLDFSLQVELFRERIWNQPICRHYLTGMFQHLIYDNCEEDPPYVHDILAEWLPSFSSALLIFDDHAGFRRFLGADPESAFQLHDQASRVYRLDQSLAISQEIQSLKNAMLPTKSSQEQAESLSYPTLTATLTVPEEPMRFFPNALDFVAQQIKHLVDVGVRCDQIVVLSPFLSDSLLFTLGNHLKNLGIPSRSIRPSIPLIDDPIIRCLLTLSQLAHPEWGLVPNKSQLVNSIVVGIDGFDRVRAQLLVDKLIQLDDRNYQLKPFSALSSDEQTRITPGNGQRYQVLQTWLTAVDPTEPLDVFISRLFGEVLSQPGFGFHKNLAAGQSTANLIESFRKFRWSINTQDIHDYSKLSGDYVRTILDGVISAQYLSTWQDENVDAVLIAPAMTFLIQNQTVDYQFWLNIGSPGWYERLEQPLTHPYVLSRAWQEGKKWTAEEEARVSASNLERVLAGLLSRCRKQVILGISEYNEAGVEEHGLLLTRVQTLYRKTLRSSTNA
ncbi:MAG: ATP-binding protein [Anaerolineaceae bacterium]